jgi:hypothetical protein
MRCCLRICISANSSSAGNDVVTRMPETTDSVFGADGVGGHFSAALSVRDTPVISIARGLHLKAICRDGFQLALKLQF